MLITAASPLSHMVAVFLIRKDYPLTVRYPWTWHLKMAGATRPRMRIHISRIRKGRHHLQVRLRVNAARYFHQESFFPDNSPEYEYCRSSSYRWRATHELQMNRAIEIKWVLHLLLPFHSICIGYCFNKRLLIFVVLAIPRFNEIICP